MILFLQMVGAVILVRLIEAGLLFLYYKYRQRSVDKMMSGVHMVTREEFEQMLKSRAKKEDDPTWN